MFRQKTKAAYLTCPNGIQPAFYPDSSRGTSAGTIINVEQAEKQYPQLCYSYILNNPIKVGLATNAVDWDYSSVKDVMGRRKGSLINRDVIEEYGLVLPSYSSDDFCKLSIVIG